MTRELLSVDSLPTSSIITYNRDERCHNISIKDKKYHFRAPPGKKGLPVRRFPNVNPNLSTASHILANTVAQNESMYTRRDVEEAKQAQELYRMLAYPSFKYMSETISSGCVACVLTVGIGRNHMSSGNTFFNCICIQMAAPENIQVQQILIA